MRKSLKQDLEKRLHFEEQSVITLSPQFLGCTVSTGFVIVFSLYVSHRVMGLT